MVFNADMMRRQAAELDAELDQARFSGQSRDGTVNAVVSGHGRLLDLTVSPAAIRGAHPQAVGPAVVDAVSAARRAAAGVALVKMRAVLDKDQVWQPEPFPAAHPADTPPATTGLQPPPANATPETRPPRKAADEENFEELDFLTDEDDDEQRGRW